MRLDELTATGDAAGHRIVLRWRDLGKVRVVRRAGAFPETATPSTPAAGVVVADTATAGTVVDLGGGRRAAADDGLPEGVHYYQVFPYAGAPPVYDTDPGNRLVAVATAPYGFGARLAALLPAVYHRFDTSGQLRRLLEVPGGELDRLYSHIRSLLDLADVRRVDGRLLPLLAAGIGWRTDFGLGYDRQRVEISQAPTLYRQVGTIPAAEAAVRRITGWTASTKEYVDNIFVTGHPERRTLWLSTRDGQTFSPGDRPLSIDSSPHGRPALVAGGGLTMVYHAAVDGIHQIRWKPHHDGQWQPSEPVVARGQIDVDPVAARQGDRTLLLWSVHDPETGAWRIDLRVHSPTGWGPITTFGGIASPQRRGPAAAVGPDGALWLFWRELVARRWQLRHARFTGSPWAPDPAAGADVPPDGGRPMNPESGLTVFTRTPQAGDPAPAFRRIGLAWAHRVPVPGEIGQTRWRVAVRFKDGSDPAQTGDWGPIVPLPAAAALDHDLEPGVHVSPQGAVRVVFASTRAGTWSIHGSTVRLAAPDWSAVGQLTEGPFADRTPLPLFPDGNRIEAICVRSNRSITRTGVTYPGTVTVDRRWSGATTIRAGDPAITASGTFDDHLAYVYDTGRTDADRYARDTVGLFLHPGDAGPERVALIRERLRRVLPEFIPATDRAVVIDARDP